MTKAALPGFLVAHGVSTIGTKMTLVALPLLVYATTGSAVRTGAVAFVEMGLYVLTKAFGTPWIDRVGRRRVSIAADLASAGTVAVIPALYGTGHLPFAGLLVLLGASGAVQGLGSGAKRVLLPDIVDATGGNLIRALTIFDGVDRAGLLFGALLGGIGVDLIGAANVLWCDAASFALSAVLLLVAIPAAPALDTEHEPYFAALRAGARFLLANRLLLGMAVMVALTNMVDQAKVSVLQPVWVTDVIDDLSVSGWLYGSAATGAVVGNIAFIWLAPKLPRRLTFGVTFLLAGGFGYFVMAWTTNWWLIIGFNFVSGFLTAALNPILSAVSFERIPDGMRARVLGMTGAISFVGIPFGGLLGGVVVSAFGVIPSLWLAGGLMVVVTLAPFVFPVWREMDRPPVATTKPVAKAAT